MAVCIDCIDVLVRIDRINLRFPGGWEAFKRKYPDYLQSGGVWYDDHLLRDGAMDPRTIKMMVEGWEKDGLIPTVERDGETVWEDLCVHAGGFGVTRRCDWITEGRGSYVWLTGTECGPIVGWGKVVDPEDYGKD